MFPAGTLAGASQVSLAIRKLLWESEMGTQRSSTQKMFTSSHGNPLLANRSNIGLGEDPPETARVARCRLAIAFARRSKMCCPHASAAATESGNRRTSILYEP